MLDGKRPFQGVTAAETMTAIMREKPEPVTKLDPKLPALLGWLVQRCLSKDPDARYSSTKDLARELQDLRLHLSKAVSATGITPGERSRLRRRVPVWALAFPTALAVALGLFLGVRFLRPASRPASPFSLTLSFPADAAPTIGIYPPALSPDGKTLGYAAGRQLFARPLDRDEIRPIKGTEGGYLPFFSSDGREVGFFVFADHKLKKIPLTGGSPVTLCDAPNSRGGSWGADGTIVFVPAPGTGLQRMAASGGEPRTVLAADTGKGSRSAYPQILAGGENVLFVDIHDVHKSRAAVVSMTSAAAPGPNSEEGLAPGRAVPKVACQSDPSKSYALYLPSAYQPQRRWPILYLFDARGRGALAVDLFRAAAERHGWILAGSNDFRSGTPGDAMIAIIRALLADTHGRLAVDPGRRYAGGFSAGARASTVMAAATRGGLAGVIGVGAGFADSVEPRKDEGFVWFGMAGETDFNLQELLSLDDRLSKLGVPRRLRLFEGGHRWPEADVCAEAVTWLEVQAIRLGLRSGGRPELDALLDGDRVRAQAFEAAGRWDEALRLRREIARDVAGWPGAEPRGDDADRAAAERLEKDPRARKAAKDVAKALDFERSELERLQGVLRKALARGADPPPLPVLLRDLGIARLRERMREPGPEGQAAARLLEALATQTGFSLPPTFGASDAVRSALCLGVAVEIRPENPVLLYNLACARARLGDTAGARTFLERAVDAGFADAAQAVEDPDLAGLRETEGFRSLLHRMRLKAAPTPTP